MKKLITIIIFLIAGIYIDVKLPSKQNQPEICTPAGFRQNVVIVQSIVPFRPSRETFYLGIGNKHYEYEKDLIVRCGKYSDGQTRLDIYEYENGCSTPDDSPWGYSNAHYIDLAFLKQPVNVGVIKYLVNGKEINRQSWVEWEAQYPKSKNGSECN